MPGIFPYRILASAAKGRKMVTANGMPALVKCDTTQDHILTAQGKTIRKFLPLQAPSVYQNPFIPAMNAEKLAIEPLVDGAKSRGCSAGAYYPDVRHDVSSGSEHEPNSVCLAAMVHEFIEEAPVEAKCGRARCNCRMGTCDGVVEPGEDENEDSKSSFGGELYEILQGLVACISEEEHILLGDVKKTAHLVREQADQICEAEGAECTKGCLKRALVKKLREGGYNAAICKSKSDHHGCFPGGSYQYIDVLLGDPLNKERRLLVDTEFRCQFEIARPTQQYESILQELPLIFVGKPERLQQIVNLMSEAVRASLRKRRMPLPPWRKAEYMRAKWLSPYKRTTNSVYNHQRSSVRLLSDELAHTAIKGFDFGLDFQFTNKLEAHLGRADCKQSQKEMLRSPRLGIKSNTFDEHELSKEVWAAHKPQTNADQITVVTTDWKPPPVSRCRSDKTQNVATLGFILKQAGLTKPLPNPQKPVHLENEKISAISIFSLKQATAVA
ncbi:hypothetical protein O6H91_04G080600 [Diphasiastrum complanatum]|uniref:Uncharacterized protein n=3 Tax=Diphasiastrum complanatum TaxID=34168 RepID=A0ACC2DYX4_DIPCM|nr:hypothetical protein O6H91_04G080600 [Diphasiastrum complanatum]KAJ7559343.1 hypothetical protein O6H91_04G080600 [Diphasiastrum complanatum]KAJ7559344.1 hypothetical protein O6H91_04G080600 [Diphasiastrum complanatum]